jgi:hypothetical protein
MYISRGYEIVYTSKAVPVLQTVIEGRDSLYLWVYNHHTVVYTDFLYYYIFRRLHHNTDNTSKRLESPLMSCDGNCHHFKAGILKRENLFSVDAVIEQMASDSSLRQCLVDLYLKLNGKYSNNNGKEENCPGGKADECYNENKRVFDLLDYLFKRELLKPWWKTVYEYKIFMQSRIPDDRIRKELAKRICSKAKEEGIEGAEFCSQIAKGIITLSKEFEKEERLEKSLNDGDFFIVERSNRFFNLKSIENIYVYLKKNTIINRDLPVDGQGEGKNEYFAMSLTNLLPYKDYTDFFDNDNFYVYLRPYKKLNAHPDLKKERDFYEKIEKLFVSVASELADMSESEFERYCDEVKTCKKQGLGELPKMLENLKNELTPQFTLV